MKREIEPFVNLSFSSLTSFRLSLSLFQFFPFHETPSLFSSSLHYSTRRNLYSILLILFSSSSSFSFIIRSIPSFSRIPLPPLNIPPPFNLIFFSYLIVVDWISSSLFSLLSSLITIFLSPLISFSPSSGFYWRQWIRMNPSPFPPSPSPVSIIVSSPQGWDCSGLLFDGDLLYSPPSEGKGNTWSFLLSLLSQVSPDSLIIPSGLSVLWKELELILFSEWE